LRRQHRDIVSRVSEALRLLEPARFTLGSIRLAQESRAGGFKTRLTFQNRERESHAFDHGELIEKWPDAVADGPSLHPFLSGRFPELGAPDATERDYGIPVHATRGLDIAPCPVKLLADAPGQALGVGERITLIAKPCADRGFPGVRLGRFQFYGQALAVES
jgi:hypothetical protein